MDLHKAGRSQPIQSRTSLNFPRRMRRLLMLKSVNRSRLMNGVSCGWWRMNWGITCVKGRLSNRIHLDHIVFVCHVTSSQEWLLENKVFIGQTFSRLASVIEAITHARYVEYLSKRDWTSKFFVKPSNELTEISRRLSSNHPSASNWDRRSCFHTLARWTVSEEWGGDS